MGGHSGGTTGFTLPKDAVDTAHMSGGGDTGFNWGAAGKKAGKGALGGLGQGLQHMQQPQQQGGAPVNFDQSQPELPPDFFQPNNYLDQAKQRMNAMYGGGGGY